MTKRIFFAILPERCVYDKSLNMAMRVAYHAGSKGYTPIYSPYGRTDITRQGLVEIFLRESSEPDDTLVMLDVDHDPESGPANIVELLAAHDKEVVVPLMFRRQEPFDACAFRMDANGVLHHLAEFPPGLWQMDGVGSGVIALQRRAVEKMKALGYWLFKYEYLPDHSFPSEDMYFSKQARAAGVEMWVDTTIEWPHITLGVIDQSVHDSYLADHPREITTIQEMGSSRTDSARTSGKVIVPEMVTRL